MAKNLLNIEDLFKKGLEGNEEPPSEEVWNVIDQSLEKANSLKFRKKYYSLKRATAILLVLLALLTIYILRNESQKQSIGQGKNKNEVARDTILDNATAENEKSPSEKRQNWPEKKAINEETRPEPGNSDLQILTIPGKKIKSQTVTAINNAKINEDKRKFLLPKKQEEELIDETSIKKQISEPSARPEGMNKQVLQRWPQILAGEKLTLNVKEDLKYITTISPYTFPFRTVNRTAIQIPRPPRFYANVFYSPNIPFSHLRDEDNRYGNPYSRELEKNEKGSYSYSFGVLVDFRFGNKWSLESGLSLSAITMNMEPEKIFAQRDNHGKVKYQINTSSGKGYILPSFISNPQIGDSLFTRRINHSLQYTGIPLATKYYFNDKRLSINLLAGVCANILSQGKISTDVHKGNESEHEKTHEIDGLKTYYFSGLAGFGLTYHFYKNFSATFSPNINFAIEPINQNVPVNSYPGTVNFQLGLKTKL